MTIFSEEPHSRQMERLMTAVPNFKPRGVGFRFAETQITVITAAMPEILTAAMRQICCPPFLKRFNEYIESEESIMTFSNEKHMVDREDATVKAYASINIGGEFVIKDIAVVDGQKGMFARMPFRSYKTGSGETKYSDMSLFSSSSPVHTDTDSILKTSCPPNRKDLQTLSSAPYLSRS